jgi:hypothetical protein
LYMQHGCNKTTSGDSDQQDPAKAQRKRERQRRQDAVERFEDLVHRARVSVERHRVYAGHKTLGVDLADREHYPTVTLPLDIAELVLACLYHRHRSRRKKRRHESDKVAVVMWAWQRRDHLIAEKPLSPSEAEEEAAKDAQAYAGTLGVSLSWTTIQRMMQSSPEHLAGSVNDVD